MSRSLVVCGFLTHDTALHSINAVPRGALGVPCYPKTSLCGTGCPPKGGNVAVSVGYVVLTCWVLRGGIIVNRVRSGRKQP